MKVLGDSLNSKNANLTDLQYLNYQKILYKKFLLQFNIQICYLADFNRPAKFGNYHKNSKF